MSDDFRPLIENYGDWVTESLEHLPKPWTFEDLLACAEYDLRWWPSGEATQQDRIDDLKAMIRKRSKRRRQITDPWQPSQA